jgi:CHAT domain-containing protein
MNLDWFLTNEELLEQKTFTETKKSYEEALKKAEDIRDHYMIQKFLLALVRRSHFLKKNSETHDYIHQLLRFSNQPNVSERQKFRNYNKVIPILSQDDLHSLAREISLECIALAEPMSNSPFLVSSRINAGIVYLKTGDFKTAEYWFDEARKKSENLEEDIKNNSLAEVFLQLGHLESKRNQFQKAVAFYDRAIEILSNLQFPVLYYEAKKSRLMAYQKSGARQKVEEDIYSTIEIAETYRKKISEEQDRNSFFDNEQTIYDIAIDHKTSLGQNEEAYDYSETSKARTLLDELTGGANIFSKDDKTEIIIPEPANPLKLTELRKKIPTNIQLLQYAVLEDKIIIWIVTKERFLSVSKSISSDELKENVYDYLKLIKQKEPVEREAKNLFNKLLEPTLPYLDKEKEICLIPDKFLFQLPFISLISPDGKYLLEEFDLFYSPSANVFAYSTELAENKSRIKNEKFLGIGNPSFDLQKFSDLEYLPEAEKEVREISGKYPDSKLLIADEATRKAFYDLYENYEVIHFAGHYITEPESLVSSKLLMAKNSGKTDDDFITNAELMRKKLPRTKLIILSACQTGIENYSNSEGLIGLSRTFLASQVPLVIGSQWKVDSGVTAEIMQTFHNFRRQENISSNKALKQAQLAYLRASKGKFKLPYYWAAFATFGGYADF